MNFVELVGDNKEIEEQLNHIYHAFCREFPETNYDERKDILGIGEPNKHLFCYFKKQNGEVYGKFKCELEFKKLPLSKQEIDSFIDTTVELFNKNDFGLKQKQKRSYLEGSAKRQKREKKI